jgi:hypothetical protein
MYDAGGAERLGVEVSCPSEASPQDAVMSCPSEASSQDVRPVVSTADAMLLSQVTTTADAMLLSQVTSSADATTFGQKGTGCAESAATTLILCDGTTLVPRSQLVNDAELSIEENQFAFSELLTWRPFSRREQVVDGTPHFMDDGGYLSDGQLRTDDKRNWHGPKRLLSIPRGLCLPDHTLNLTDEPDGEKFLIPCLLVANEDGKLRIHRSAGVGSRRSHPSSPVSAAAGQILAPKKQKNTKKHS